MTTRREVSGKYRMEVTAVEECVDCHGTGICIEQSFSSYSHKLEILLSICACVRILPRLSHDPNAREVKDDNI
jgi:hypothetical protein